MSASERTSSLSTPQKVENFDEPDGNYFIRDGIIIIPKGATIPDGTEI